MRIARLSAGDLADAQVLKDVPGSPYCTLPGILPEKKVVCMNEWPIDGGRVILIGDVHGCYRELMSLLELVEFKEDRDRVCLLGDVVNKGPDSLKVLQLLVDKQHSISAIRGNHDDAALMKWELLERGEKLDNPAWEWVARMSSQHLLRSLPLIVTIPAFNIICVHAGVLPDLPLESQEHVVCTKLRMLAQVDEATDGLEAWAPFESNCKHLPRQDVRPWWTAWTGPGHVVFGHDARKGLQLAPHATGLDTNCCMRLPASRLSGMILGPAIPTDEERRYRQERGFQPVESDRPGLIISVASSSEVAATDSR